MTNFRLATDRDDAILRSMLRDNGIPTWVDMAIEREPSVAAGMDLFGRDWAVIGEERGEAVAMYTAAVLPVYVNGRQVRLGYLGGLRVAAAHRKRIRVLREGYCSVLPLAPVSRSLPWWFTVIASDNTAARRLLEAGIADLPTYSPLGEYVTLALPTARGRRRNLWRQAREDDLKRLLQFQNDRAAGFECAPALCETAVRRIGLDRFLVYEQHEQLRGVAGLWDQRAFKQIVARGYRRPIGALRPIYSAYAAVARRVPLPPQGTALEFNFIAFLAVSDDAMSIGRILIEDLLSHCTTPIASLGLNAFHPLVRVLRGLAPLSYPARVYAVTFDDSVVAVQGDRPVQPEAALL